MVAYLKIVDIAEKLGADRNTIARWARLGIIPSRRISQKLQFDPQEIEDWLERSRRCRLYLPPNIEVDLSQFESDDVGTVDLVHPGELFPWARKTNQTDFTVFLGTIGQAEKVLEHFKGMILEP